MSFASTAMNSMATGAGNPNNRKHTMPSMYNVSAVSAAAMMSANAE